MKILRVFAVLPIHNPHMYTYVTPFFPAYTNILEQSPEYVLKIT